MPVNIHIQRKYMSCLILFRKCLINETKHNAFIASIQFPNQQQRKKEYKQDLHAQFND